jgi:hypothetical protein
MNEKKEEETNNKEKQTINKENNKKINLNDDLLIKEVNKIGKEKEEIKINENKEKPQINNIIKKDEKLKEIFQLINSPINSIKRNKKLETSKEKIQNFLNDSLNESKSKNSNSNNKKMNKNKYQELYDQINLIDSMNTIKKNKPLIPYSQYKNYSIKKSPIKKIEIKTQKLFKKYDNLFSDLENPKKSEWINNNLFKSNKQKEFFDIGDNNLGKINFDNTEKKLDSYYKNELNFFGQRLNKGNYSISNTPNNNRKNIDSDFTIKFNKNNALEKLNNW